MRDEVNYERHVTGTLMLDHDGNEQVNNVGPTPPAGDGLSNIFQMDPLKENSIIYFPRRNFWILGSVECFEVESGSPVYLSPSQPWSQVAIAR